MIKTWEGPSDENDEIMKTVETGNHLFIINASGPIQVIVVLTFGKTATGFFYDPRDDETPMNYSPAHFIEMLTDIPTKDFFESDYYFLVKQIF